MATNNNETAAQIAITELEIYLNTFGQKIFGAIPAIETALSSDKRIIAQNVVRMLNLIEKYDGFRQANGATQRRKSLAVVKVLLNAAEDDAAICRQYDSAPGTLHTRLNTALKGILDTIFFFDEEIMNGKEDQQMTARKILAEVVQELNDHVESEIDSPISIDIINKAREAMRPYQVTIPLVIAPDEAIKLVLTKLENNARTSRSYKTIYTNFDGVRTKTSNTQEQIKSVIELLLQTLKNCHAKRDSEKSIVTALISAAKELFFLLQLHKHDLCKELNDLNMALKEYPNETYETLLMNTDKIAALRSAVGISERRHSTGSSPMAASSSDSSSNNHRFWGGESSSSYPALVLNKERLYPEATAPENEHYSADREWRTTPTNGKRK